MSYNPTLPKTVWYFSGPGGEKCGPVTAPQLRQLAREGKITSETLLWKEGLADWVPASRIKGLEATAPRTPGSPPPSPAGASSTTQVIYVQQSPSVAPPGKAMARAAGWMGFIGFLLFPPLVIVGLILSIVALTNSEGRYGGPALVMNLVVAPVGWIALWLGYQAVMK